MRSSDSDGNGEKKGKFFVLLFLFVLYSLKHFLISYFMQTNTNINTTMPLSKHTTTTGSS